MSLPLGAISRTGIELVNGALFEIGVLSVNESAPGPDLAWGFQLLNELLDSWIVQQLTTLVQEQHEYPLVSGQGTPDNPYTIGPQGNFDVPQRPDLIRSATLSLKSSVPPVEIPLAILTDDMQSSIQIKSLQTQLANYLYYKRTVPLGEIQLWPVPNTSVNSLVLYTDLLTPTFATPQSVYVCPPMYARALRRNLAQDLLPSFGVPPDRAALVIRNAESDMVLLKESNANAKMADLMLDPALVSSTNRWGSYNILSDQGS